MDFDCLLTEPACAKEMFDVFTTFCGVFFAVGALLFQWSIYDPDGPGTKPHHDNHEDDWP